jgi:hypothetical protein
MGYINSAATTTLTAKLTPIGRQKIVSTDNSLITSFSFGDSDANYYTGLPLTTGNVPNFAGSIGANNSVSNSVGKNVSIKSYLLVNDTGTTKKLVEPQSNLVTITNSINGFTTATTLDITQTIVNRGNSGSDELVNLFYSFGLPLTQNDDYIFTGLTTNQGGYSNTSLSGLAQDSIIVIGLDESKYGETIDGKSIKLSITTLLSAYTIYSTFQNNMSVSQLDANISDISTETKFLGDNIALLFSDDIRKPNNDSTLSWATGWGITKPFTSANKQPYNLTTNTALNQVVDLPVGVAYLDKGFAVITHPDIVDFFDITSTATTMICNSISTIVEQNITCIANRGEFGSSTNPSFSLGDLPRISEVGLYDNSNELIAIAKMDKHLVRNENEFMGITLKINL